jgi:hypothetical protein
MAQMGLTGSGSIKFNLAHCHRRSLRTLPAPCCLDFASGVSFGCMLFARSVHLYVICRQSRPVTLNQDQRRPSWFNISRLPPNLEEYDENGVASSVRSIENIILSQVYSGIDPGRIVLVGFSQGAALGMMVALTTLHELGGVASLSGWIPRHSRDVSQKSMHRKFIPWIMVFISANGLHAAELALILGTRCC